MDGLNAIVEEIADTHGRLDGLIAAAGIQQETPALEYSAKDCDTMMSVNVTGCFMTAQAAAKQMVRFGNGGSIVMIASMSGTIANRVCISFPSVFIAETGKTSFTDVHAYRDSFVRPIMHLKQLSSNWVVIWPLNGANTVSASTPFLQAISSPQWSRHCSRSSLRGKRIGLRRICWED